MEIEMLSGKRIDMGWAVVGGLASEPCMAGRGDRERTFLTAGCKVGSQERRFRVRRRATDPHDRRGLRAGRERDEKPSASAASAVPAGRLMSERPGCSGHPTR